MPDPTVLLHLVTIQGQTATGMNYLYAISFANSLVGKTRIKVRYLNSTGKVLFDAYVAGQTSKMVLFHFALAVSSLYVESSGAGGQAIFYYGG